MSGQEEHGGIHVESVVSDDGVALHVQVLGQGPSVLLLHGLFSTANTNWIRYGTAARLVQAGYRLILPDLRGHGESRCPADKEYWPADVLAADIEAIVRHFGLGRQFVLGGYSLGARTAARLLARGLRPRAAILAGMGLSGLTDAARRSDWFLRMIRGRGQWQHGSGEFLAERFMRQNVPDPEALIWLLQRQENTPLATLRGLSLPVLVVAGADDHDNGSAPELAAALANATYREIPGNHMGTVIRPELGEEICAYLGRLPASSPES